MADGQRVAERNQICGPLHGHDAGESCRLERVALLDLAAANETERFGAHRDLAAGERLARRHRLVADVDHLDAAALVDVGQMLLRLSHLTFRRLLRCPGPDRTTGFPATQ